MTQDTTTMPVMASDTAALVEAMGMAMCAYALGGKACPCKERGEFRCLEAYPGYQATVAYNAMHDTLVPVGYRYDHPKFGAYCHTDRRHVHEGWTETPLYTLPELKP